MSKKDFLFLSLLLPLVSLNYWKLLMFFDGKQSSQIFVSIWLHQYYFSRYSDYSEHLWTLHREEISYALKSDLSSMFSIFQYY